ncbi:GOLPH3/VPS74 family protein [Allonocardiopsis opalescens]|uniref:Golgi phosphoprotein 3 GPP34 n=1 Tax=Allonocardiopsis opalescens TaxID=1144618 RepID=A0A2T0Q4U2_9ACTN|nr:GPP34 family phosphoprotein [Allonocardiopsis opalescens]PRX98835.1 Golgi phosphoprotein 3 GPP34 [Allonocardiopsis opalescens]
MDLTLPERLYLLCCDLDRQRFDPTSSLYRDKLLRAAALAELTIQGLLTDRKGKAARSGGPGPQDPVLAQVLADVPPDKPRSWTSVVLREQGRTETAVRTRLAEAGVITVERRRLLGLIPIRKVTPRHPDQVRLLREQVRRTAFDGLPESASIESVCLAAIAAEGDVASVFTPRECRNHKTAVKAVKAHFDAAVPGVRKAVLAAVAHGRSS